MKLKHMASAGMHIQSMHVPADYSIDGCELSWESTQLSSLVGLVMIVDLDGGDLSVVVARYF